MEALQAIAQRHSTRAFAPQPVPRDVLEKIVDAGRLAATARNVQPWEFVVATRAETRRKLADLTDHGKFIAQAPACVALFCRDGKYFIEDGSAATENILVAAAALGVQSCWVAGDKKPYAEAVAKLLKAPAGCRLMSLIPLGYARGPEQRAPKRPLKEVLRWESF